MTAEDTTRQPARLTRRTVLVGGAATVAAVGVGAWGVPRLLSDGASGPPPIGPGSELVAATERGRATTGRTLTRSLTASPRQVDLGGRVVDTWGFGDTVPGAEIRLTAGDRLKLTLDNRLPDSTSVHWHGLALRNDMDGVPTVTQDAIGSGDSFTYDFVVPDPGTYWFHPHVGVQLDSGLYAPLIVEDPAEPGAYDDEVVLVLDDWTDGLGQSPKEIFAGLAENGMGSMDDMDMSGGVTSEQPLGSDTGDVDYPAHLINGRLPADPHVIRSRPGRRLRMRLINAGGDTAYRFAIGNHRLTVTHTDGFAVRPVTVDTLIIGMGERYDVLVDVADGTYPVVAVPEGKDNLVASAALTTTSGRVPALRLAVPELNGRMLSYGDLSATEGAALGSKAADRELDLTLSMGDGGRQWLINDRVFEDREPLLVEPGERVRLTMRNESSMFHPMHLHGHTFAIADRSRTGARKDTLNVLPQTEVTVEFDADNPGQWLAHCHNVYHGELGMMTVVSYVEPP